MMRSAVWLLFPLAAGLPCAAQTCVAVAGDRILARDLARAVPAFSAVAADTPLAYAPVPGARRIFRVPELRQLAARFALTLENPADVCFELPMEALEPDRLIAAMRQAPGFAEARIEVLEFSRFPVPRGTLEFPPAGLGAVSDPAVGALWKGYVRYGAGHRFGIWARARISVTLRRVVAVERLREGQPIQAAQVRLEEYQGSPGRLTPAPALEQVIGRLVRRSIPAGSVVSLNLLSEPNDISRGESVAVEARSGAARLAFTGRAETGGRLGQSISVRNPQSGKTFSAKVVAKGKAVVTAPRATSADIHGEDR